MFIERQIRFDIIVNRVYIHVNIHDLICHVHAIVRRRG